MIKNPMDNKSAKEREEEMGLTDSQKAELEAVGLTKAEIREIHNKRLAEAIDKEKKRLAKLEEKVQQYLPKYLAEELENNGETAALSDEEAEKQYEMRKFMLQPDGKKMPWDGMKDLIFTNADYWKEIDKVTKGDEDLAIPQNVEDMTDDEFNEFYEAWQTKLNDKTSAIFDRRRMGAMKAEYDWVKGHCKGPQPEGVAAIMV